MHSEPPHVVIEFAYLDGLLYTRRILAHRARPWVLDVSLLVHSRLYRTLILIFPRSISPFSVHLRAARYILIFSWCP